MVTNNNLNNATAASGTILQGQGVGTASAFSTATFPASTTANQILYSSATNTVTGLVTANTAILATNSSGVPSITTASGNWLNTSRCAFLAYLGSSVTNATGAAVNFNLGTTTALTEVFDQSNNFVTSGTFTAPVTGLYYLGMNVYLTNLGAGHTTTFHKITTTVTTYTSVTLNPLASVAGSANYATNWQQFANMTAGDTATFGVQVTGGAQTVTVLSNNRDTNVWGYLVC